MWRSEDGGPDRRQVAEGALGVFADPDLCVTTRLAPLATMVVSDAERTFLLRHTFGDDAVSFVEQLDDQTLEPLHRSPDLPGGPTWPGGMAVAPDGSVHVVFGNHAHRLDADLQPRASIELPRQRPYNSFVVLDDGALVTKDFGGSRPGQPLAPGDREPCELLVLDPDTLQVAASLALPEPSIARLTADGDTVYVVGDTSLLRVEWDGRTLHHDDDFRVRYLQTEGQGFGWDCVLAAGSAWFLDDGDGSEDFAGTLRGAGRASAPLSLHRVSLASGSRAGAAICGLPGGLVANPPVVDERRRVAVGYDSGNGMVAGFDVDSLAPVWRRPQDHGSHLLLYEDSGELVTGDGADIVVLDVATGDELARVDSGLGMQSVLFPAPGRGRDFVVCAFTGVSRVSVGG